MAEHAPDVVDLLQKEYPDVQGTELNYRNPLELLVATILSAQATDKLVNRVTEKLFQKYSTAEDYARADLKELQEDLSSINFYRNKASYIQQSARRIVEDYGGQVPDSMEELVTLPGVSRKTANVVLSNAYGKHQGIVVDTHVMRLSQRLGLTDQKNRDKIEQDLMALFPRKKWFALSNLLIAHGRRVCRARHPQCGQCVLQERCPYYHHVVRQEKKG